MINYFNFNNFKHLIDIILICMFNGILLVFLNFSLAIWHAFLLPCKVQVVFYLMDADFATLNLVDSNNDEDVVLPLESTAEENLTAFNEFCLVVSFLMDKPTNFGAIRNTLSSLWRPGKRVFMQEILQCRFLF